MDASSGDSRLKSQPMRVLLWSPAGSGRHYGGPGMSAYRLYRSDTAHRFRLDLAHGSARQQHEELFEKQYSLPPIHTAAGQLRFQRAAARLIPEVARQYDVLHGLQGFDLTVLPAVLAEKHGLPAVVKLAAWRSDLAEKGGWRALLRRPQRRRRVITDRISAVIAISTAIRDELLGYGIPEHKIALIPNGVDTDLFRPARDADERRQLREHFGWPDRPTVLFVGGINRRKRPHLIAEALVELHRRGEEAQLVLAGPVDDEPYLESIRATLRSAKLEQHLIHVPFTPDVAPLYRAADVFCLPSQNEGMPNAVLEAMASGVPCLVTPISGTTDLVEDGVQGQWIEDRTESVADVIMQYLSSTARRQEHGRAARERVEQHFSTSVVLARHDRIFRQIVCSR